MKQTALPEWYEDLRRRLSDMAEKLPSQVQPWQGPDRVLRPEDMGYQGGMATESIQAAMDRLSREGGGTLRLSHGDYVTGTLVMRSRVCLQVDRGCRLLGSLDLKDYPEHICRRVTVQDTHMGMNQALIFAEDCENIAICGPGEICGRGTQENFPGDETQHGTPGRPFLIRLVDCRNVHVHDLKLRDAACWMENYFNCDHVLLENLTVRNQVNYNNDGIDIDGCRHVIVRGCDVQSGDDALCFKGASERNTEKVLVENCRLYSSCNALKIGTDTQGDFREILVRNCEIGGVAQDPLGIKHPYSDSGISLEMVDGGTVEEIWIHDMQIHRAWSPVFLRLEDRGRRRPDQPRPQAGTLRRVILEDLTGEDNGPRGSYMLGIPEKPIMDVVLNRITLRQNASLKPVTRDEDFDDMRGIYPDAHMIDDRGDAPAYELWARYVDGLWIRSLKVETGEAEKRPARVLERQVRTC